MGKIQQMKKYFLISGFNLEDSNRGTAALSYGSISFLEEHKYLLKNILLSIIIYTITLLKLITVKYIITT